MKIKKQGGWKRKLSVICESGFSSDEVAAALGCCRSNTTRKIRQFEQRLRNFATEDTEGPEKNGRLDNKAERMIALMETGGRLARADRQRLKRFVMRILET